MPRGRLIFPFLATVVRLDTEATAADPGVTGATSGYDPIFREPLKLPDLTTPTQPSTVDARKYLLPIDVLCQVEPIEFDDEATMFAAGKSPSVFIRLVFHYRELEAAGLVGTNGEPLIRLNDRLTKLARKTGETVRIYRDPGFFAVQVQDIGHGIGPFRNLLLVDFQDRKTAE